MTWKHQSEIFVSSSNKEKQVFIWVLIWRSSLCHENLVPGIWASLYRSFLIYTVDIFTTNYPWGSDVKESACSVGEPSLIPGSGRSPGEGHGNPLHSFLWNTFYQRCSWPDNLSDISWVMSLCISGSYPETWASLQQTNFMVWFQIHPTVLKESINK